MLVQPVIKEGAGVSSLGSWGVDCATETKERRARRTRTGFFMNSISEVDGTGGKPAASKGKGAPAHPGRATLRRMPAGAAVYLARRLTA